ncbi:MAG: RES domain-containing protein [Myxococcales bacterium]|nr:RES domain-containing protein [Myxococcales bacterium]
MATPKRGIRFQESVYRAHNPEWAWDPLSGAGAKLHGGRFNRRGQPALYTSLDVLVAVREASPLGAPFHPLTLCEYRVDCMNIFDTRDSKAMRREKVSRGELECPSWNQEMLDGQVPASHQLADRLIARGYAGMVVRSFALGAGPEDMNLVLWKWTKRRPHKVTLFDPDHRLPRDDSSWRE